jgi:hypothetical protein
MLNGPGRHQLLARWMRLAGGSVVALWVALSMILLIDGGPCSGSAQGCTSGASLLFVTLSRIARIPHLR